jgi:hypothetical protein
MRYFSIMLVTALVLISSAAAAQNYSRSIEDGKVTVRVEGARGGEISRTANCANGSWGCATEFSATGAGGNTIEGSRKSARGPFRGRSLTTVTGPKGNTAVRANRWRR